MPGKNGDQTPWIFGGVAIAVSVLMASGRFTPVDTLIGITLLLILRYGACRELREPRFDVPYSALMGVCWLLILGFLMEIFLAIIGYPNWDCLWCVDDEIVIGLRASLLFPVWLVISWVQYGIERRNRNKS